MKVGIVVPQGWTGEYDGWDPQVAWQRTVGVARQAERLGFESIWLFDHFHTFPDPTDEITFESFNSLADSDVCPPNPEGQVGQLDRPQLPTVRKGGSRGPMRFIR